MLWSSRTLAFGGFCSSRRGFPRASVPKENVTLWKTRTCAGDGVFPSRLKRALNLPVVRVVPCSWDRWDSGIAHHLAVRTD